MGMESMGRSKCGSHLSPKSTKCSKPWPRLLHRIPQRTAYPVMGTCQDRATPASPVPSTHCTQSACVHCTPAEGQREASPIRRTKQTGGLYSPRNPGDHLAGIESLSLGATTLATLQPPHEGLAHPFFGSLQIAGPIDISIMVILNLAIRSSTTAYGSDETLCFHSETLTRGPCSLELQNFLSQLLCTCARFWKFLKARALTCADGVGGRHK